MGKDHYTAAREGTDEIGLAVAATTFSIVVVFVPIAFMGGIAEQWMAPFALTIACSVLVSLFVSFSLDPMLSAYWPDPHLPMERSSPGSRGRSSGSTTGSTARPIATSASSAGRSTTASRWSLLARRLVRRRAGACRRSDCSAASSSRCRTTRSSRSSIETPPGSNLAYTRRRPRKSPRSRASMPGCAYTYATIGGPDGRRRRRHASTSRSCRRRERDAPSGSRSRATLRNELSRRRRRHGVDQHQRLRQPEADPGAGARPGHRRACSGSPSSCRRGRGRCRAPWTSGCRRAGRSRSSTCGSIAGSPARSAHASDSRAGAAAGVRRRRRRRLGRSDGQDARRHGAARARSARAARRSRQSLPLVVPGRERPARRRVPLGQVATIQPVARARRGSTTSIANA